MSDAVKVTVFTPAYNRAYCLGDLYESLKRQTLLAFEWLIVDDGSIDSTADLVQRWLGEDNPFEIRYIYQQNGGKHRAINRGVGEAKGTLFFIVDSDDYLTDDAVEKLVLWEASLPRAMKYAGISGNRCEKSGALIGTTFDGNALDCTHMQREDNGITGDKAEAYYTEILRKFPFPTFEGESFITERVVWDRIAADGYLIRYYNESIYVCEHRQDGLVAAGGELFAKNPKGTAFELRQRIELYQYDLLTRLILYYGYYVLVKGKLPLREQCNNLGISCLMMECAVLLRNINHCVKTLMRKTPR